MNCQYPNTKPLCYNEHTKLKISVREGPSLFLRRSWSVVGLLGPWKMGPDRLSRNVGDKLPRLKSEGLQHTVAGHRYHACQQLTRLSSPQCPVPLPLQTLVKSLLESKQSTSELCHIISCASFLKCTTHMVNKANSNHQLHLLFPTVDYKTAFKRPTKSRGIAREHFGNKLHNGQAAAAGGNSSAESALLFSSPNRVDQHWGPTGAQPASHKMGTGVLSRR